MAGIQRSQRESKLYFQFFAGSSEIRLLDNDHMEYATTELGEWIYIGTNSKMK